MKGQGEPGRGGSRERERKREGKEGREKNKGVFTCLWNQQLAALSHNLRHMDVIRTTVSVCECVSDYICVWERESTGVSVSLRCRLQKTVTFLWCSKMTVVLNNPPLKHTHTNSRLVWNLERPRVTLHKKLCLIGSQRNCVCFSMCVCLSDL